MENADAIVVGAGLWGCTVARRLADAGRKVLLLEHRGVLGGMASSHVDPTTGIEVHDHGAHIFHSPEQKVWDFIGRFTDFNTYRHKVVAKHKGRSYFLPVGLALVNKFFDVDLTPADAEEFMKDEAHAKAVSDAFFRGYTAKQWGVPLEKVDPSVVRRIPVRYDYDLNYFDDLRQGIPVDGYCRVFERMVDHPNVKVRRRSAFWLTSLGDPMEGSDPLPKVPTYYSGPIDRLFSFAFGSLPWRSLWFETETINVRDFQGTSVVNYCDPDVPFTRIHEYKHFHPEQSAVMAQNATVIAREHPVQWDPGVPAYYPVDNPASRDLYARYREELAKTPWLTVGGRLGEYRYYDMDHTIRSALEVPLQ